MNKEKLLERIVIDSKIMVGKPTIKGTRLTVQLILKLLAQGMSTQEVLSEYQHITEEDIHACLLFAANSLDRTTFAHFATGTHE